MKKSYTKNGFTIIEVSIASMMIVIVGISILGLQRVITDVQVFGFSNSQSVEESNFSINQISKELRTLRNADNGSYPFVYGDDNQIIFYSDIDSDGASERVRYFLTGSTLSKGVIQPTGFPAQYPSENETIRIITENVSNDSNPVFLYFNEDWPVDEESNPIATPVDISNVKLVKIYLKTKANEQNQREGFELTTSVQLRTLKDNL